MSHLETDVSGLKEDVAVLKTDVGGLKADATILKIDMGILKTNVIFLNKFFWILIALVIASVIKELFFLLNAGDAVGQLAKGNPHLG